MFKVTLKSIATALSVLAAIILILTAVDGVKNVNQTLDDTYIKVTVVDLDGLPIHNANVSVGGQSFFTDNKGVSPSIELSDLHNAYDNSLSDWSTVTVKITKEGYVPTFVFNCIVFHCETRNLTVKIYPRDGSDLPYVNYVESPPEDYIRSLLKEN